MRETPQQWDERLRDHIENLRREIAWDEEAGRDFMRSQYADDRMIEEVASNARSRGSRIFSDGATLQYDWVVRWAEEILETVSHYPFRLDVNAPEIGLGRLLPFLVVTEEGASWFNTSLLSSDEKLQLVEYVALLIPYNNRVKGWRGYLLDNARFYPSKGLMGHVHELMLKYGTRNILAAQWVDDEEAQQLLGEYLDSEEYAQKGDAVLKQLNALGPQSQADSMPAATPVSPSMQQGTFLERMFNASGRSSRSEYILTLLGILIGVLFPTVFLVGLGLDFLALILQLLLIPVWIIAHIRRLHDCGQSGWIVLLLLVPFIGFFLLLYLMLAPGAVQDREVARQ